MKQRNERIGKSNNGKKEIIHTWIKYLFFLITLLIFLPAVSLADADKIFKENSKAVVVVTAYDERGNAIRHGSGFIVRQDGVVVTNYHVIGMAKDIKVMEGNKVLDVEGLIFIDKENDLVILKAKARSMPVVKLGVVGKADIGKHVYIIGRPSGFENAISVGLLSEIRKIGEKVEILRMTAPASPGMSGSPVVNRNGEVVGVVTSGSSALHNFSSAISVKLIKGKISSERVTSIKESGLEDYINTASYWNSFGLAYYESGKYKDAIDAYKRAIKVDPDYTYAHLNLGVAYLKSHMQKNAVQALKRLTRIDPDDAKGHYNLGVAYYESGKYKDAIEAFKQAIRINPDFVDAHYNLGKAYGRAGKYKDAIDAYKQAIKIDPDNTYAHLNLGVAYLKSHMQENAIEELKRLIRIDPDNTDAHLNLCLAYLLLNDRGSAIEQYKILKILDSDKADGLFNVIYK
jgi:tetratricopeptide (TPR) repeat protein